MGWELYERTGSAMVLGGVGLVQVIPIIALTLFAGHVADKYDRKRIMMIHGVAIGFVFFGVSIFLFHQGTNLSSLWLFAVFSYWLEHLISLPLILCCGN